MAAAIRIIGIDPGLRRTGWGIIRVEGSRLSHVADGTLSSNDRASLAERLKELHDQLTEVFEALRRTRRRWRKPSSTRMPAPP